MLRIKQVLTLTILSLATTGLINPQEIKDSQLDFDSVPTSVQSGITKAMNREIQKADEV